MLDSFKTTTHSTCQNNHKPEVKRQEKSNNDFTSAASDPVLVGKMDLEKLLDDHADQVNAQNMYYQAYNETYFCEISEYGQRLDAAKEYAIAYLEIYLNEAEAPSVIERGKKENGYQKKKDMKQRDRERQFVNQCAGTNVKSNAGRSFQKTGGKILMQIFGNFSGIT